MKFSHTVYLIYQTLALNDLWLFPKIKSISVSTYFAPMRISKCTSDSAVTSQVDSEMQFHNRLGVVNCGVTVLGVSDLKGAALPWV